VITCESAYKPGEEIVNNSAIPLLIMPPHRTTRIDRRVLPVPRVMGYSAILDTNEDEVFTRLDLPLMDPRDVVPYTTPEYPSLDNVSPLHQLFFFFSYSLIDKS
jgi:hypothetical protein